MVAKAKIVAVVMLTAICGVGVVTWETPQNLLLFVIWSIIAIIKTRRLRASSGRWHAIAIATAHAIVMASIVIIAMLASVKRIDAVLRKPVQLQANTMTVKELSEYCESNRALLPLRVYIPSGGIAGVQKIVFPSTEMPLQHFIAEVERQTGCTHRFGGCGNAYSILYGDAYNFGLSFVPPSGSDYEWQ